MPSLRPGLFAAFIRVAAAAVFLGGAGGEAAEYEGAWRGSGDPDRTTWGRSSLDFLSGGLDTRLPSFSYVLHKGTFAVGGERGLSVTT